MVSERYKKGLAEMRRHLGTVEADDYIARINEISKEFAKENVEDNHPGVPTVRGVPCFHYYLEGRHIPELTVTGGDIKAVEENLNKLLK